MEFLGSSGLKGAIGFTVAAVILAIVATVLAFIFIVPEKKRDKLNAFGKFLHDTCNFKYLVVEKLLQALYIFATSLAILNGFFMLFQAPYGHWLGGAGLLTMVVGPIVLRLVYELLMMMVLLVKNVIMINKKLKNQNDGSDMDSVFTAPDMSQMRESFKARKEAPNAAPAAPVVPPVAPAPAPAPVPENQPHFCANCGSPLDAEGKCPNCGK